MRDIRSSMAYRCTDSVCFPMDPQLMRDLYAKFLKTGSSKPHPFTLLNEPWRETAAPPSAPSCRAYRHEGWGLCVLVSLDAQSGGQDYLTFSVTNPEGPPPSVAEMRAVRRAFLGNNRVAFFHGNIFNADQSVRVMYSTLDGESLPVFTRGMNGLPV